MDQHIEWNSKHDAHEKNLGTLLEEPSSSEKNAL